MDTLINFSNVNKINIKIDKIFSYVNAFKWSKIKKILKDDETLDINVKDSKNIYFLEYIILHDQPDILKMVIDKIQINIYDYKKRNILYSVIKYNRYEILEILLEKNKNLVGVNLLEQYDSDNNDPIFYTLIFNTYKILNVFINDTGINFNHKNMEGLNYLHYSIKYNNIEFTKLLLDHYYINSLTSSGESPLHVAIKNKKLDVMKLLLTFDKLDINIEENINGYTALHYIAMMHNIFMLDIIMSLNYTNTINPNIQDQNGNTLLHHFVNNIMQNDHNLNYDIYKKYEQLDINYNLYNIDGNTALHLYLYACDIYEDHSNILITFIQKTDLNIQNKYGESPLFIIVKKGFLTKIDSNILINKKHDIFIINAEKKTMIEYIKDDEINEMIQIITKSYMLLKNKNQTYIHDDKDDNEKTVFERIKRDILQYTKTKKITEYMSSYPLKHGYLNMIENIKNVIVSSYSTSAINVFFGLLYLTSKYKNTVLSPINYIDEKTPIIKCNNNYCDVQNYTLLWSNLKLYIDIHNFKDLLLSAHSEKKIFIVPLGIELYNNTYYKGHANYLLFDFKNNSVERFEPYGGNVPYSINYSPVLLDNEIKKILISYGLHLTYYNPKSYLPDMYLQYFEINEFKYSYLGEPDGYCSAWCIFWIDLRLKYQNIPNYKLIILLKKEILNSGYTYKQIIRNYISKITTLRDNIMTKSHTNINDWNNDIVEPKNINKLKRNLHAYIDAIK